MGVESASRQENAPTATSEDSRAGFADVVEPDAAHEDGSELEAELDSLDEDALGQGVLERYASHRHSERARDMSFEEAVGSGGCGGLRAVLAVQGVHRAKELYETTRATMETGRPVRLVMPPSKSKTAPPPGAAQIVNSTKSASVEAALVQLDAKPASTMSRRHESERASLPAGAEIMTHPTEVILPSQRREEVTAAILAVLMVPKLAEAVALPVVPNRRAELVGDAVDEVQVSERLAAPGEFETGLVDSLVLAGEGQEETEDDKPVIEQDSPLVIFERFASALTLLSEEVSAQMLGGQAESSGEYPQLDPLAAAVVVEVASRLADITTEQKEAALPIVQGIAETLQMVRQQQGEFASAEELSRSMQTMREQVANLFQAIGLEYDDQKIELFIQALLTPSFALYSRSPLTPEELASMGMHEVKLARHIAWVMMQTTLDGISLAQRLGRDVLLIIRLSYSAELWPELGGSSLY